MVTSPGHWQVGQVGIHGQSWALLVTQVRFADLFLGFFGTTTILLPCTTWLVAEDVMTSLRN